MHKQQNGAIKKEYKDELVTIIHKHVPECKIYLFGSRATGNHRPGSDIDLALDAGAPIPFNTIIKIQLDIDETTIPMTVDLVDLNAKLQDALRDDINREGILWTN